MLIKISSGSPENSVLFARQTPGLSKKWKHVEFAINENVDKADWWVVCHASGLLREEVTLCDPNHLVFISMEPPIWGKPEEYYRQFSHLVTCDRSISHPNLIHRNGVTWWAGLKVKFNDGHIISPVYSHDYDSFADLQPPPKLNRISVITSKKKFFPGHEKRLAFLDKLRRHEVSKYIDFYGAGSNPIEDKLDALLGYKYHLALENSAVEDYWTEKIADPFLAWCMPVYYGCPNIEKYFPSRSYASIDLSDFDSAAAKIMALIENNCYDSSLDAISKARDLVLGEFNIFELITGICRSPASRLEECVLRPHSHYSKNCKGLRQRAVNRSKAVYDSLARFWVSG